MSRPVCRPPSRALLGEVAVSEIARGVKTYLFTPHYMARHGWRGKLPASDDGVRAGCTCPRDLVDVQADGHAWLDAACPLHGRLR